METDYSQITAVSIEEDEKAIAKLKHIYSVFKRLHDSSYTGMSDHWKFVWPKLIQIMKSAEISDPVLFMQAQFESIGKSIRPNELISDRAIQRYFEFTKDQESRERTRLMLQAHKVKTRMRWKGYREILMDRNEELTPLVRVCFAADEKMDDVVNEFLDEAVTQYVMGRRIFDIILNKAIPEVVKCRADRLLPLTK